MPAKDRHGKTAQDYRSAPMAELNRNRGENRRFLPLFVWPPVPAALIWLNWHRVQRWLNPAPVIEPSFEVADIQKPAPTPLPPHLHFHLAKPRLSLNLWNLALIRALWRIRCCITAMASCLGGRRGINVESILALVIALKESVYRKQMREGIETFPLNAASRLNLKSRSTTSLHNQFSISTRL